MKIEIAHNDLEFELNDKSNFWWTTVILHSEKILIDGILIENGELSDESLDFMTHFIDEFQELKRTALEASQFISKISTQFDNPENMKWDVLGLYWREDDLMFDFIYQVNDYSEIVVTFDSNVEPWYMSMVNTIAFGLQPYHSKIKELHKTRP